MASAAAVVLAAFLLAYSAATNLLADPDRGYVARNTAAGAALLAGALALGLEAGELGLGLDAVGSGLAWGGLLALAVVVALTGARALAPHLAAVGGLLSDRRADLPPDRLAWHALWRIPVGTAAFEEVAFRGVLLGVALRAFEPVVAVAASSLVFGLWHLPPTAVALDRNEIAGGRVGALAGAVAATTAGGAALAWLRLASDSLLAPVLVHWAVNAAGLLAAARWQRARRRGARDTGEGGRPGVR